MSTKTTFKRVALVTVAALGFGMLSSVNVASAANTEGVISVTQVTTARLDGPVVLKVSFPFTTDASVGADDTVTLQAKLLTTAPGASALDGDDFLWQDWKTANLFARPTLVATAGGADTASDAKVAVTNGSANDRNTFVLTPSAGTANAASTSFTLSAYAAWTPNKAGTWNWVVWSDTDGSGTLNAAETSANISVVVEDTAIKTVTVTSVGGAAPTTASVTTVATGEQALVKITLTGADGLPALPRTSEYLTAKVTTGAAYIANINDASSATNYLAGGAQTVGETGGSTVTAMNLNYYNFGINGAAYLNVKNATEEVAVITATVGGTAITGSGNQTFTTASGTTHTDGILCKVTTTSGCLESAATDPSFSIGAGTKSVTYYVGGIAAEDEIAIDVTDTAGLVTGLIGADFSKVATASDTVMTTAQVTAIGFAITAYLASFSVTSTSGSVIGGAYSVTAETNAAQVATVVATTALTATLQSPIASAGTLRVAPGATNTFVFRCVDDLGGRKANVSVTTTLTGRNAGLFTMPTAVTNASGEATISYTDLSTSTTNLTDSLSFAGCSTAATATVSYSSAAGLGVATVTLTGGYYTASVANATITTSDIGAGVAGPSATTHAMTATVKDAAGNLLAGVPVAYTIAGTGCAIPSTSVTKYTGAAGTTAGAAYGWLAGDCTVTATAGGIAGTAKIRFAQNTALEAHTLSAVANGSVVTATVKDRFGNPVLGAPVYAKITGGSGYFGSGTLTTDSGTGGTSADGTYAFIVAGDSASVSVSTVSFSAVPGTTYGQTSNRLGQSDYNVDPADDTAYTATTVGTTTTIETGVGASFAAAGVNTATVSVTLTNTAADNAQAATDAAAEATDAANAATDAANAAAEAADAATAAAQDAADAVAALSAQVATLISGLKAQLTALTNLVIKIQKKVKA
jgi:hypothetical protein